jgi:hypothetical protein
MYKRLIYRMKTVLSKAERKFLQDLEKGSLEQYSYEYRKLLKHRILKKHKTLTEDALMISKLLDKIKEL